MDDPSTGFIAHEPGKCQSFAAIGLFLWLGRVGHADKLSCVENSSVDLLIVII